MHMKNLTELALAFCKKNLLLYIDIAECVKGGGRVLFASKKGVLAEHTPSGILMLAAEDEKTAELALKELNKATPVEGGRWLVARAGIARETAKNFLSISRETTCFQVAYLGTDLLAVKGELCFRLAERKEIEIIKQNYGLEPPENMEKLFLEKKIYCGFNQEGEFVGFIGSHPEGSMGMLHIFPEYRRKGYAEELETRLANEYIASGRVPYGHVIVDNLPSLALQKKLGLEVADEKICWLRVEE